MVRNKNKWKTKLETRVLPNPLKKFDPTANGMVRKSCVRLTCLFSRMCIRSLLTLAPGSFWHFLQFQKEYPNLRDSKIFFCQWNLFLQFLLITHQIHYGTPFNWIDDICSKLWAYIFEGAIYPSLFTHSKFQHYPFTYFSGQHSPCKHHTLSS